jgi:hypothetical protein
LWVVKHQDNKQVSEANFKTTTFPSIATTVRTYMQLLDSPKKTPG